MAGQNVEREDSITPGQRDISGISAVYHGQPPTAGSDFKVPDSSQLAHQQVFASQSSQPLQPKNDVKPKIATRKTIVPLTPSSADARARKQTINATTGTMPTAEPPQTPPSQRRLAPRPSGYQPVGTQILSPRQHVDQTALDESPDPLSFSAGSLPSSIINGRPLPNHPPSSLSPLKRKYDAGGGRSSSPPYLAAADELQRSPTNGRSASSRTLQPAPSLMTTMRSKAPHAAAASSSTITRFDFPEGASSDDEDGSAYESDGFGSYEPDIIRTPRGSVRRPPTAGSHAASGKSTKVGMRGMHSTGGRAHNIQESLKKLEELVEDVFEAEDNASVDVNAEDLERSNMFSVHSIEAKQALLAPTRLVRLSNLISRCRRPTGKRKGVDDPQSRLAEWPQENLRRLLRMLDRSVGLPGEMSVFVDDGFRMDLGGFADAGTKKQKGKAASKKKKKASESAGSASAQTEDTTRDIPITEDAWNALEVRLGQLKEAVMAAECMLNLLSADELPKPLYSEDQLKRCLTSIAQASGDVLVTFLNALQNPADINSTTLAGLLLLTDNENASECRQLIHGLLTAVVSANKRLTMLISSQHFALPDDLVVQTVYLCMRSLFVSEILGDRTATAALASVFDDALEGKGGVATLRRSSMSLLVALFSYHSDQRDWIVEEVLGALVKLSDVKRQQNQYRLRNGQTIHVASALLLELIQSCGSPLYGDGSVEAASAAENENDSERSEQEAVDGLSKAVIVSSAAVKKAEKVAMMISRHLLQKATATSANRNKTATDAEFKAFLGVFVDNQLTVLYMPEWPGSVIGLLSMARLLKHTLDSQDKSGEMTAARAISLEQLGNIGTKIRKVILESKAGSGDAPSSLNQILCEGNLDGWRDYQAALRTVRLVLVRKHSPAVNLTVNRWLLEIHGALRDVKEAKKGQESQCASDADLEERRNIGLQQARSQAAELTHEPADEDVFKELTADAERQADAYSRRLEASNALQASSVMVLQTILTSMEGPGVAIRTKALRALQSMITADPALLLFNAVKTAMRQRFNDSSPAVRDAALDLVGTHALKDSKFALQYYNLISSLTRDSGLAVRKHVIKLMKAIYGLLDEREVKIDICHKLVAMIAEEDDENVQELAVGALREIWIDGPDQTVTPRKRSTSTVSEQDTTETVEIIARVVGKFRNALDPFADLVKQMTRVSPQKTRSLIATMIDRLIDQTPIEGAPPHMLAKAVHLFATAIPDMITAARASALLPYLQTKGNNEDLLLTETLLGIFRLGIPHMPKTATNFAQELSKELLPIIHKPVRVVLHEEATSCFAVTVDCLTRDYRRVLALLKSTDAKLQAVLAAIGQAGLSDVAAQILPFLLTICATLPAYCDVDKAIVGDLELETIKQSICKTTLLDHVFKQLLRFSRLQLPSGIASTVISSIGTILERHPVFILRNDSMELLDDIFSRGVTDRSSTHSVLKVVHGVLVAGSEAKEGATPSKAAAVAASLPRAVDMRKLIGSDNNFAQSSVLTALMQRCIGSVAKLALLDDHQIQRLAIDVISLTVAQGLVNPLEVVPTLVCLQACSNDAYLVEKSIALHTALHVKHPSVINARHGDILAAVFNHQQTLHEQAYGYRDLDPPEPLIGSWYHLAGERRQGRLDFLRSMSRSFSFDKLTEVTRVDVLKARFLAENLLLLPYQTLEEPLLVVQALTASAAEHAAELGEILSTSTLKCEEGMAFGEAQLAVPKSDEDDEDEDMTGNSETLPALPVIHSAILLHVVLQLRDDLKRSFGITEDTIGKYQRAITKSSGSGKKARAPPAFNKPVTRKVAVDFSMLDRSGVAGLSQEVTDQQCWEAAKVAFLKIAEAEDGVTFNDDFDDDEGNESED